MTKTIEQSVEFPGRTPDELFDIYTDAGKHAAAVGATAEIRGEAGAPFSLFDGGVRGRNLFIVPDRMVVQSWRAQPWKDSDLDSVLVLTFRKTARGAVIDLIQSNVPDHAYDTIRDGWVKRYWEPWKGQLATR